MAMKIGTARDGYGKEIFKMKDGDNIFRILPPLGDLAAKGRWSVYYAIEWGYKDIKNRNRPFQNCRVVNRESKMVEVESEAHLVREQLKAKQKQLVEEFKAGRASKEQVEEISKLVQRYNLESKNYMNAVNLNGKIGLLKIGYKTKLLLDAEIEKLKKQGVDPRSVANGRYFNFFKSGVSRDTQYQVTLYQENITAVVNGVNTVVQMPKVHVMDDTFIDRLETEAWELDKIYPIVTAEQTKEIVHGGPAVLTRILGDGENVPAEDGEEEAPVASSTVQQPPVAQTAPVAPPIAVTAPPVAPIVAAPPIVTTPVVQTQTVTTPVVNTPPVAQTDEEWLKSMGM